jgi:hypothetical protein
MYSLTHPAFAPRPAPRFAPQEQAFSPVSDHRYKAVKRWIWIYFWLLIFEGSLRKWVLPGASRPLLVIRDPVVLLIYFEAFRARIFPFTGWMLAIFALATAGLVLGVAQIFSFQANFIVVAYGWRSYFLHLPLIFIMPKVLNFHDLHKFGRWILLLSIPMTVLMCIQFAMPPDHWINVSAIEGKAEISGSLGHIRPPGTFSFISGPASFYPLVIAFSFAAMSWKQAYPQWLRLGTALGALLALPISGSRLTMANCLIVLVAAMAAFFRSDQIRRVMTFLFALTALTIPILTLTPIFNASLEAFQQRWTDAAESEGQGHGGLYGMTVRTTSELGETTDAIYDADPIGAGLGMGTNVGSVLMADTVGFQLAENEWPRVVLECGPFFGLMVIALRLGLTAFMFWKAWRAFTKEDNLLAWLLFASCGLLLVHGQTGQPTPLGFMVFSAGLCLTACEHNIPMLGSPRPTRPW